MRASMSGSLPQGPTTAGRRRYNRWPCPTTFGACGCLRSSRSWHCCSSTAGRRPASHARAAPGHVLQHPLRYREGRRQPLVGAPRATVRRDPRTRSRSRRAPGSAGVSDRRDPDRGARLCGRRRRPGRWRQGWGVLGDLFKKGRFRVADAGTFWFSDTPEVPASKSWGNNITRICTWARLIDRDGRGFYHFNLHLDHESQPSRDRSTALLRQRIDARAFPTDPVS